MRQTGQRLKEHAARGGGALLFALSRLVRATAHVREEHAAPLPKPAIFVNWHRHLPLLMVHHGAHHRFFLMSAAPKMAPIARWATLCGLQLVRGASGERGSEALEALEAALAKGESVVLAVDGPAGPAFQVRPGCIELSRRTRAPIVPVAYVASPSLTVPGRWDRMSLVLPLGSAVIRYGPVLPLTGDLEQATQQVADALNALER